MTCGAWNVGTSKAQKQIKKLPSRIGDIAASLLKELEDGPIQTNWPHYSALVSARYYCHLKRGHPTYLACWRDMDKQAKKIEVYYVGTHENAPY